MPYIGKKPENIIATAVDSTTGTFSGAVSAASVDADGGVTVDNITIDGTEIDLSSGDLTIDVAGDIILDADGADIKLLNDGTHWGSLYTNATPANLYLQNMVSDGDIYLSGSDGGSNINALVLDMSAAGAATFNSTIGTPAGSASAPSHTFSSDTNTGMFKRGTDQIGFTAGGTEALAITSGGIFADTIGNKTSNGNLTLDVAGDITLDAGGQNIRLKDDGTEFGQIYQSSNDLHIFSSVSDADFKLQGNDGGSTITALQLDMSTGGQLLANPLGVTVPSYAFQNDSNTGMTRPTADTLQFITGGSEQVRIASQGYIYVNTGGAEPSASQVGVRITGEQGTSFWNSANSGTGGYNHLNFYNDNGLVGNIYTNGSGVVYNTGSDYRLKENVVTDWDATTRLKQLKPSRFNFIADADTTLDGFLAHEVSSIVPEAISGTKDGTEDITNVVLNADGIVLNTNVSEEDWTIGKSDGTYANNTTWVASKTVPKYQGIDQSKLVPLLTKALQEQQATIEALTARIVTLENA